MKKKKNRIKEIIKSEGLTQESFAKKIGVTRSGLIQLLNSPSYPTLIKISEALDVPLWQLFASPDEVQSKVSDNSIVCPHCGKEIHFSI